MRENDEVGATVVSSKMTGTARAKKGVTVADTSDENSLVYKILYKYIDAASTL